MFALFFPASDSSSLNEPVLQGQVEKLNRQNTEHSHGKAEADIQRGDDRGGGGRRQEPAELILDGSDTSAAQSEERKKATKEEEEEEDIFEDSESEEEAEDGKVEDDGKKKHKEEEEESSKSETSDICKTSVLPQERYFWLFLFYFFLNLIYACHRIANSLVEGEEKRN